MTPEEVRIREKKSSVSKRSSLTSQKRSDLPSPTPLKFSRAERFDN